MHFVVAAVFFVGTNLSIRTVALKKSSENPSLATGVGSPTMQEAQ
jgi:hypothetical protein